MNMRWFLVGTTIVGSYALAAGCSFVNAPSEVKPGDPTAAAGGDASSSSSGSGGMGGSTSSSSSSSSGMVTCTAGTQIDCYDGAPLTAGVGVCKSGKATCLPTGEGYGPCEGQVVNAATDDCKTPLFDENCDGVPNDGCGPESLAIVAAAPTGYASEVATLLTGTQAFASIKTYNVGAGMPTPTLADLQQHTVVLIFSDLVFADPVALGDVVADYFNGGGRVVLAMFSILGSGTRIQGKFGDPSNGYLLINPMANVGGPATDGLGDVLEPQSPLMQGVSALSATGTFRSIGGTINGATVVAQWSSGYPLVVRGTAMGRNRVDLNFYPPQTQMGTMHWSGNGVELLRNALLY